MSATDAQRPGPSRRLTLPADLARVAEVREWLKELAGGRLSESRFFDLQVTVSEATANAIEHAASEVEIEAWLLSDRVIVEVTNDGVFRPGLVRNEDTRRRGLGLPLMVSLADQVHVSRLPSGKTQVSLTFFYEEVEPFSLSLGVQDHPRAASGGPSRFEALVWLIVPLLVVLGAVLYGLRLHAAHEYQPLLTAFNSFFLAAPLLIIAYLAGRGYVNSGSRPLVPLGIGALVLGIAYLIIGPVISVLNESATIHNGAILVAGACFALSAFWTVRGGVPSESHRRTRVITVSYLAAFVFTVLLVSTTLAGFTPAFFVQGQGYTPLRSVILGLGVVAVLVAATYFLLAYRRARSRFLLWFCSGLALLGLAFAILVLARAPSGTAVSWLGRSTQWLAGLYLLVGIFSLERGPGWSPLVLEQALRESEDRYKNLVELSPDAILVDVEGKHVFANPAAARLLGARSPDELVGKDALEYVHRDDRDLLAKRMSQVLAGGVTPPREFRLLRLDGTPVTVEVTGSRVQFGGRLANQAVIRDITERKRAEEALRSSEKTFAELIERSPFGTYIVDSEFRIAFMNASSQAGAFRNVRPLIGRPFTEAMHTLWPDDVAEDIISHFRHTLETGEPYYSPRFTSPRHDLEIVESYEWELHRLALPDGKWGVICYYFDSTTLRDTEEALRQSEDRYRFMAQENERLYRQQLEIAENLQAAFLHVPSELGSVRVGHLYRSATEAARVGGDFYDVFEVKDKKVALLMGDVAGHGIAAARAATLVKDVVHAFIHQTHRTHEVLRLTNTLLIEKELPGYVTLFLGILDTNTGELQYSSAGHPEMLMRRASAEIERLGAGSAPLGIYTDAVWKPSAVELHADDLLVLFTDGVIEARHDGELFGEKRLGTLVGSERIPAERLPEVILDQVLDFSGGVLQDDVAILAVRLVTKAETGPSNEKPSSLEKLLG